MSAKPVVDLCIVAAQRPDLVARTLSSFRQGLLDNLAIGQVIANIDPVFGDSDLGLACRDVILDAYPEAKITMPETPGFCAAIKRNWSSTSADFIFHLEDDWDLNHPIGPEIVDQFADPAVAQIILHSWHMEWPVEVKGRYCETPRHVRLFGMRMPWKVLRPLFPTSPSFFRGSFAREAAAMLDTRYDADKQMREWKLNPALNRYAQPFRAYIYGGEDPFPITDTGREWRERKGIEKRSESGTSAWVESN